jgi:tRNA A58 N-methylase Trm61
MQTKMQKIRKAEAPTSFGIFSPTGHVVMAFASENDAQKARTALAEAGFPRDSITYYSSADVLGQIKGTEATDVKAYQLGQETEKVDRYAELAERGAGVLVVYAPKEDEAKRAVKIAKPFKLEFAEKYNRLTLEELA